MRKLSFGFAGCHLNDFDHSSNGSERTYYTDLQFYFIQKLSCKYFLVMQSQQLGKRKTFLIYYNDVVAQKRSNNLSKSNVKNSPILSSKYTLFFFQILCGELLIIYANIFQFVCSLNLFYYL